MPYTSNESDMQYKLNIVVVGILPPYFTGLYVYNFSLSKLFLALTHFEPKTDDLMGAQS